MDVFKNILAYFGGIIGILMVLLTIFKNTIEKFLEEKIRYNLQKDLVKINSDISRSNKAHELVINKEFDFYFSASEYVAKLIVDVQDLYFYFCDEYKNEREESFSKSKKIFV